MRALAGFPQSSGSKRESVFPHAGPASYEQVDVASPLPAVPESGGDLVYATEAGMKYFDHVGPAITDDSLYRVDAIPTVQTGANGSIGGACSSYRLRWTVVATGAEVAGMVDLSGSIVRLRAIGPQ